MKTDSLEENRIAQAINASVQRPLSSEQTRKIAQELIAFVTPLDEKGLVVAKDSMRGYRLDVLKCILALTKIFTAFGQAVADSPVSACGALLAALADLRGLKMSISSDAIRLSVLLCGGPLTIQEAQSRFVQIGKADQSKAVIKDRFHRAMGELDALRCIESAESVIRMKESVIILAR